VTNNVEAEPGIEFVQFTDATNATFNSETNVLTASAATAYAKGTKKIPANEDFIIYARVGNSSLVKNGMIGLNTSNTSESYTNYEYYTWVSGAAGNLFRGPSNADTGVDVALNNYY
jgi:hypothetical protein